MSSERRFEWGGLGFDRADYVSAPEALAMLEVLAIAHTDLEVETGLRDGSAWARFARGERWAVVSTPGSRWFSVDVDTGHRLQLVDANSTKDETAQLIAAYVDLAAAYVRGEARPRRGSVWAGTTVTVHVDGRDIVLVPTIGARLRSLLGR